MLKKGVIITVTLSFILIFNSSIYVSASDRLFRSEFNIDKVKVTEEYLTDYSSLIELDSEVGINYANYTSYSEVIKTAADNWNSIGLTKINEAKKDISLFIVEKDFGSNGILSSYVIDDTFRYIVLNKYYMDDLEIEQQEYILTHELGHALGLIDLPSTLGNSSVMIENYNTENNRISIIDILILSEIVNNEDKSLISDLYDGTYNLGFCSVMSPDDPATCDDNSLPGGSDTSEPTIEDQVLEIVGSLQVLIDDISAGNILNAYGEFSDLIPAYIQHECFHTCTYGVYASFGGLWLGGSNILPLGGTVGLQFTIDPYGFLAAQVFWGVGIHILPHADVVAFSMFYFDDLHYYEVENSSIALSSSLFLSGPSGEYLTDGSHFGIGYSASIFELPLSINLNLTLELQNTETLGVVDLN
jgi:hypothetical protein